MNAIGSFCFGKEYETAHLSKIEQSPEVSDKMIEWMRKPNNIFYFCGNVGNGKTYFAAAWYNLLKELKKNVRIFTEPGLFSHLKNHMHDVDPYYELSRLCEADNFILDDLGSGIKSDWRNELILEFVNVRTANHMPTLITSNLNKAELQKEYGIRLTSRIYSRKNTVIELNGPDRRA